MRRTPGWLLLLCGAVVFGSTCSANSTEKFPPSWRKTMTNDPATNFYLTKFTADLGDPLQTAARNFVIARLVGSLCQGAKIAKPKLVKYLASAGMDDAAVAAQRAAYDGVRMTFNQFDYRELAHLCAGIEYMFGSKGKLIAGVGKPGKGEPRDAYDPLNPYLRVETLIPRP
jgi:hypothetical protein